MIKRNVSTPPKENGEYFCYDNYGNKRVVSFKNGGWLTSDRNSIVSWVDETPLPEMPNEIDLNLLSELLAYSDRYEISIQFWPGHIAVFVEKDGVDLKDYGGDFNFAVTKSVEYLNRINNVK